MKKKSNKQTTPKLSTKAEITEAAKQRLAAYIRTNYPKTLTAYKVPIADLLNPACPISAVISENLRTRLLAEQAAGEQYHFIEDYIVAYTDVVEMRKELNTRLSDNGILDQYERDKPDIINIDAALDPDNPLSVLSLSEEVYKVTRSKKIIGDSIAPYLEPEEATFFINNVETIAPLVNNILLKMGLDPNNITVSEIAEKGVFAEALKAAGYKSEKKPDLPQVPIAHPDKIYLPVDVVNNQIWSGLEKLSKANKRGQIKGQLSFVDIAEPLKHFEFNAINAAKNNSDPAFIILGTDFEKVENTEITKTLTEYDKLVYQATGSLWRYCTEELKIPNDQVIITTGLIYWAMGNNNPPGAESTKKIIATLSKLRRGELYLNNVYEVKKHKNQAQFNYKGVFLPSEEIQAIVNGVVVESAIHLFREPPLISFARERGQITTINRNLLAEMPLDKSERNIGLFHYLITQIAFIKNPKNNMTNPKILYATIFEKLNIDGKTDTDKKARQRTKNNARKLLKFFTDNGIIDGYIEKELQGGQGVEIIINMPKITQDKSKPTEQ